MIQHNQHTPDVSAHSSLDYSLCPMILSKSRMVDVLVRSNEEHEFCFDVLEGAIIYVALDADEESLTALEICMDKHKDRFIMFPKLTLYEVKKYMDLFISEKITDVEIKEKLSDVLLGRNFKEKFPEVLEDYVTDYEKWSKFFFDKLRLVAIEWLCQKNISFVFEEDICNDIDVKSICLLKETRPYKKVSKFVRALRKQVLAKAETYYSMEVLHPKPKRGRPPKKVAPVMVMETVTPDIYVDIPESLRYFIYRDFSAWNLPNNKLLYIDSEDTFASNDIRSFDNSHGGQSEYHSKHSNYNDAADLGF